MIQAQQTCPYVEVKIQTILQEEQSKILNMDLNSVDSLIIRPLDNRQISETRPFALAIVVKIEILPLKSKKRVPDYTDYPRNPVVVTSKLAEV